MARFSGKIGYGETAENPEGSGIWEDTIIERQGYGDVEWANRRSDQSDKVLPNLSLNNSISVVADAYATRNYFNIRYVVLNGVRWAVTTVEVKYPRLILYIGSVYNGPTP